MIEKLRLPFREPPEKVLCLDWHDGPVSGLAEYRHGVGVYQFRLVSNPVEEPRFYALSPSPLKRLADLEAELQMLGSPRRPLWAPIWKFASKAEESTAALALAKATPERDPVAIVVARGIGSTPLSACYLRKESNLVAFRAMYNKLASVREWESFVRQCDEAR